MRFFCHLVVACSILFATSYAYATLYDRGGGLVYDSILNITWLQDANYARTSGYDSDGLMDIENAVRWASWLDYYDSVRKVIYRDWRLPKIEPVGNWFPRFVGASDVGYNTSDPRYEMANLWYASLGNIGQCAPIADPYLSNCEIQTDYGLRNTGPFINMSRHLLGVAGQCLRH